MNANLTPLRAAIYARFSHADGDSDSVEVQTRRARQAIRPLGWTLVEAAYADDGVSGREMVRRPGYQRLLAAAARREFDAVVVRDLDRFARGETGRVLGVLQQLADCGVRLWSYTKKDFVRIDDEHALMTAFATHSNRQEAQKASARIKDKLLDREQQGGFTSAAPYGFLNRRRKPDGTIGEFPHAGTFSVVIRHPEEFPIVTLIGDLFLKLGSYNAVATELNERAIASPQGGAWAANSVRNILGNPAYRGKLVRGRTVSLDSAGTLTRVDAPAGSVRTYEHPELRVWDDATLARIDALIALRTRNLSWSVGRKHLSSSFVRCGRCGGSVALTSSARSKSSSYCCSRTRAHGCEGIGYRAEHHVDAAVLRACGSALSDDVLARTKEILRETLDVRRVVQTFESERARLVRELATADRRIQATQELVLDSQGLEREHHRLSLRDQLANLATLKSALANVEAAPPTPDPNEIVRQLEARVDELRAVLAKGGLEALPAVQTILGGERFTATRLAKGWHLRARISSAFLFDKAGKHQKAKIKPSVTVTPATVTVNAPAAPAAPAAPSPADHATSTAVASVVQPAPTAVASPAAPAAPVTQPVFSPAPVVAAVPVVPTSPPSPAAPASPTAPAATAPSGSAPTAHSS